MHTEKIYINTVISFVSKIILLILGFISRKIFLNYLGEELVGLSAVYSNLLDLLNISELGIGTAVQYKLYEAIASKNTRKINQILYESKKIYYVIGTTIFLISIIMTLKLDFLVGQLTFSLMLCRISFLLYASGISVGYFWVHKRLFLQTNEELYLVNLADTTINIMVSIVRIIVVIVTGDFLCYVSLSIVQAVLSNIFINIICKSKHPDITAEKPEPCAETVNLNSDLRYVIPLKVSNYIYKSTDNVIISRFLGLVQVTLYSNYMMIVNYMRLFYDQLMNIIQISMGIYLNEVNSKAAIRNKIEVLNLINYFISSICLVVIGFLSSPFIKQWLGEKYILPTVTSWILAADIFVFMGYQPLSIVYNVTGRFREDRNVTLCIAICNLCISLICVPKYGITGVILGTLISDIISYIYRTYIIMYQYLGYKISECFFSIFRVMSNIGMVIAAASLADIFLPWYAFHEFIWSSIFIVMITIVINVALNFKRKEFSDMLVYAKRMVKR